MKLKICKKHNYTLKNACPICKEVTKDAHYKYKSMTAPKTKSSVQSQA